MVVGVSRKTYKLYPASETLTRVPFGTGNPVYTLPEVPTIGFVRGKMSSCIGVRDISKATVCILNVSYAGI